MLAQQDGLLSALERLEKEIITLRGYMERVLRSQQDLSRKLEGCLEREEETYGEGLDVVKLLKLPDHLRKTMLALSKLVEGRADEVALATDRARAVESGYLNQLVRLGYVKKIRKKHEIYFTIVKEE